MKKRLLFVMPLTVCAVIVSFVFAQILPEGMISYWKLDEGINYIANDSVNDNHGIIYGATWTTGKVDGALSFDGSNDYVYVLDQENLDTPYELTVEAWIKSDTFSGDKRIISKHEVWNRGWLLHWEYGYMIFMVNRGDPGRPDWCWAGFPISNFIVDKWYHLAGTYSVEDDTARLYVNGVEVVTKILPSDKNMSVNNEPVRIATHPWGRYFDGIIDEIAIYNRALTACEIYRHYENGLAGKGYTLKDSIETLIINIEDLELPKGTENSLTSKLDNALSSLERGRANAAKNMLNAFINEVDAQSGKKLTDEQADELIIAVQCIIDQIQEKKDKTRQVYTERVDTIRVNHELCSRSD